MPLFGRRSRRDEAGEPPPSTAGYWQRILEADQQALLVSTVLDDLAVRGLDARLDGDAVIIVRSGDRSMTCGLDNLAQLCLQVETSTWSEVVHRHFETLLVVEDAVKPDDFATARPMLRLRLYPADMQLGDALRRRLTASVITVPVLDYPTTVRMLLGDDITAWSVREDEIFSAGAEGTWSEPSPERSPVGDPDGEGFLVLHGESFYTASHILHLPTLIPDLPAAGALLAVPNRHIMAVHPMRSAKGVVAAINGMIPFAWDWLQRGPGAITADLIWWHDGHFVDLPVLRRFDSTEFHPTDEFTEALNRLA
jgi:hypothetical protein